MRVLRFVAVAVAVAVVAVLVLAVAAVVAFVVRTGHHRSRNWSNGLT